MTKRNDSFLLLVDHLDAVTGRKKLELLHCDHLLASEVPAHQVLELAFLELEAAALDEVSELNNADLLSVRVTNTVEQSFQKLVVLLLVCELVRSLSVECAHKLAELFLIDTLAIVASVALKVVD